MVQGGFVVGPAETPKTIRAIIPLQPYLANFVDGTGKEHTQVVLFNPTTGASLVIHESLAGTAIVSDAQDWFSKAFKAAIQQQSLSEPKSA